MRRWTTREARTVFSHNLFQLESHELEAGADRREALVLHAPDWVNVIPVLEDGRVVLIRQWRFGIAAPTIEIPGGMVDQGEAERAAAERELFEETGYRAAVWERIGEVRPNPAFISNRCGTWLATGLEWRSEPTGDGEEEITVEPTPLAEVPGLVSRGVIDHALVIAAFHFLHLRDAAQGVTRR